jgi:hypothetical protein
MWNFVWNALLGAGIVTALIGGGKFNYWDKNPGQYPHRDRWHP